MIFRFMHPKQRLYTFFCLKKRHYGVSGANFNIFFTLRNILNFTH